MDELRDFKRTLRLALQALGETELAPSEQIFDLEQAVAFLEYKYNFTSEDY